MKQFSLLFWGVFLTISAFSQSIVYVTPAGAGTKSGTSWANALSGVQLPNRVVSADSGTQFWIAAGTYKPTTTTDRTASFSIASGISVYGGFAGTETSLEQRKADFSLIGLFDDSSHPAVTTFSGDIGQPGYDSENSIHVVQFTNADATTRLDGVYIMSGFANIDSAFNNVGGGIYNNASLGQTSNPTIANCTIRFNNSSLNGGGIYNNGYSGICNPIFINCTINGNHTSGLGGGIYNNGTTGICNPILRNCIITGNSATQGSAIHNEGSSGSCSPIIANCIFKGNIHGQAGGGVLFNRGVSGNCQPVIINSIFWENFYSRPSIHNEAASPSVTYCDVEDNYPGLGNINQDPKFFNFYINDFRLLKNSPAINTGDPSATLYTTSTTDLEGKPRILDGRIDKGVIEYKPNSITGVVHVSPNGNSLSGSSWIRSLHGGAFQAALSEAAPGTVFWLAQGIYIPTPGGTDQNASFIIPSGVSVYGGFIGTETALQDRVLTYPSSTTLSGVISTIFYGDSVAERNSYHVVKFHNVSADTRLDGVVIKGGNANLVSVDYDYQDAGGGILNIADSPMGSSPLITNCLICKNRANAAGGGIYSSAIGLNTKSIRLSNCVIENNTSNSHGGGIYIYGGNSSLINCKIANNTATWFAGGLSNLDGDPVGNSNLSLINCLIANNKAHSAGGISNTSLLSFSHSVFINCSIVNNTATVNGGGLSIYSGMGNERSLIIKNCMIWGNTDPQNTAFSDISPSNLDNHLNINYSLIQNDYQGTGDLNADPLFVDAANGNFRLQPTSPAINAGSPDITDLLYTDIAGNPRIQGNRVDIGAYEFGVTGCSVCLPFTISRIH
ncbi:choice-of-anchor Q domain-containing protein [Spirosoma gilvum]